MTNQEKKEFLGRYRSAGEEVQRLGEEIAQWESRAATVTTRYGVGPRAGGSEDRLQAAVEHIDELRDELSRELERQLALRREIEAALGNLPDERLRQLLRYRYIQGWTWEKISEKTYTDPRWLHRLHDRALDLLTMESHHKAVVL